MINVVHGVEIGLLPRLLLYVMRVLRNERRELCDVIELGHTICASLY